MRLSFFSFFFVFLSVVFLYAAPLSQESFTLLDEANIALENGEIGSALLLCEKARQVHQDLVSLYFETLTESIAPKQVKKVGDDLQAVYVILKERNDDLATNIIDTIYLNYNASYFNNSLTSLISWLKSRQVFPEADIFAGKVYQSEGEYALALSYFEKAWTNKFAFDVQGQQIDLAYSMSTVAQALGDKERQEKYLLLIVQNDPLFAGAGNESSTLQAMIRTLKNESNLSKFFMLYRHSNISALKAYTELSSLYWDFDKPDKALYTAVLASIISITALSDAVQSRDFTFSYISVADLFTRVGKNKEIALWAESNGIWDSFDIFLTSLEKAKLKNQTNSMIEILAKYCPYKLLAQKAQQKFINSF